jgi:hypothetical protein
MAPTSGAYINEANPFHPNWKADFFGSKYDKLLEINKEWDPEGIFWCKPCVGHALWTVVGALDDESAVGQNSGRICRQNLQ